MSKEQLFEACRTGNISHEVEVFVRDRNLNSKRQNILNESFFENENSFQTNTRMPQAEAPFKEIFWEECRGFTPLHFAIWFDKPEVVVWLLKCGANVEQVDAKNRSPLQLAFSERKIHIMKIFHDHGLLNNLSKERQKIWVILAVQKGYLDLLKFLVTEVGFNLEEIHKENDLFRIAISNRPNVNYTLMDYLLEQNLNLEGKDQESNTILHLSVNHREEQEELVGYLLRHGNFYVDEPNKDGEFPLLQAAKNRHHFSLRLLLEYGVKEELYKCNNGLISRYKELSDVKIFILWLFNNGKNQYTKNRRRGAEIKLAIDKCLRRQAEHKSMYLLGVLEYMLYNQMFVLTDQVDESNNNILHVAAKLKNRRIIAWLIMKSDKMILNEYAWKENNFKEIPFNSVAENGWCNIAWNLFSISTLNNNKENSKLGFLSFCVQNGFLEVVKSFFQDKEYYFYLFVNGLNELAKVINKALELKHYSLADYLMHVLLLKSAERNGWIDFNQYLFEIKKYENIYNWKVNFQDSKGMTAIGYALKFENFREAYRLLAEGAEIDIPNSEGISILKNLRNNPKFVEYLLDQEEGRELIFSLNDSRGLMLLKTMVYNFSYSLLNKLTNLANNESCENLPIQKFINNIQGFIIEYFTIISNAQGKNVIYINLLNELKKLTYRDFFDEQVKYFNDVIPILVGPKKIISELVTLRDKFKHPYTLISYSNYSKKISFANVNEIIESIERFVSKYKRLDLAPRVLDNLNNIQKEYERYIIRWRNLLEKNQERLAEKTYFSDYSLYAAIRQDPRVYTAVNEGKPLQLQYREQLISKRIFLEEIDYEESNYKASSPYVKIGSVYYRLHSGNQPCFPAEEYMALNLYNLFEPERLGVVQRELVHFIENTLHYSALAAPEIKGIRLEQWLTSYLQFKPQYCNIKIQNFSAFILTTFLMRPKEARLENFVLQLIPNEEGVSAQLVCIHYGQVAEEQGEKFLLSDMPKCALYFLPQMEEEIEPTLRECILQKSPLLFIIEWLIFLQKKDRYFRSLDTKLGAEFGSLGLPMRFEKGRITAMYNRLVHIRNELRNNQNISLKSLFHKLFPAATQFDLPDNTSEVSGKNIYAQCKKFFSTDPARKGKNEIQEEGSTYKNLENLISGGEYSRFSPRRTLSLDEAISEFFKDFHWNNNLSWSEQNLLLDAIKSLKVLTSLTLNSTARVTDEKLIELITSLPNLRKLVVTEGIGLRGEFISELANIFEERDIEIHISGSESLGDIIETYAHPGLRLLQRQADGKWIVKPRKELLEEMALNEWTSSENTRIEIGEEAAPSLRP